MVGRDRGQMRTFEALLASGIIAMTMVVMISLVKYPDPYATRVRGELTKYCYDLLASLADQEVFDKVIFNSTGVQPRWEGLMKNVLNALLPANLLYNMTVYNMTCVGESVKPRLLNSEPLTNASPEDFKLAKEAAGADITYITRRKWVLKIHLEVAAG